MPALRRLDPLGVKTSKRFNILSFYTHLSIENGGGESEITLDFEQKKLFYFCGVLASNPTHN